MGALAPGVGLQHAACACPALPCDALACPDCAPPLCPLACTGEDLRHALDCTLAGTPNERKIRNSIGCNISESCVLVAWRWCLCSGAGPPCV